MVIVLIILLLVGFLLIGGYTLYRFQQRTESKDKIDITDEFELDFSHLEEPIDSISHSKKESSSTNGVPIKNNGPKDFLKSHEMDVEEIDFDTSMPVGTVMNIARMLAQSGNKENAQRYLKPINTSKLTEEERKQYDDIVETLPDFNNEQKNSTN